MTTLSCLLHLGTHIFASHPAPCDLSSGNPPGRHDRGFRLLQAALALLAGLPLAALAAPRTPPALRAVALHADTATGHRFVAGIRDAIEATASERAFEVEFTAVPYSNEQRGLETLFDLLQAEACDVLLGPTESGIFADAIARRGELEQFKIPVISSLVTADIAYLPSGYFFRTNVGVHLRSRAIYVLLAKYWVRSITILYPNTEFGRSAEAALRRELEPWQEAHYVPLLYTSVLDAEDRIRDVVRARPEAVGLIGEREDLPRLAQALQRFNTDPTEFKPLLFTIIDSAFVSSNLDGFHYVAVTETDHPRKVGSVTYDDVNGIAFDTTRLVLETWGRIPSALQGSARRAEFRERFEALMKGYGPDPDSRTRIRFKDYENITLPSVLHVKGHEIRPLAVASLPFTSRLTGKFQMIVGRYGFWPLINLLLIALCVVGTTVADIRRWYSKPLHHLLRWKNRAFWLLLGVNLILVITLYLYMGETQNIRYDSLIAALALAIAPLALLRATLFETQAGKSIGLGKMYDNFLQWVNSRLMVDKHLSTKKYNHLVAYHNSLDGMAVYLRELYRSSRTPSQRIRLETELEETVKSPLPYADRRKAVASLLLRHLSDTQLQEDGLLPSGNLEQLDDPEVTIRRMARFCARRDEAKNALMDGIQIRLDRFDPARRTELEATLQEDLAGIIGEQGCLRRRIAFYFLIGGYDPEELRTRLQMPAENDPSP